MLKRVQDLSPGGQTAAKKLRRALTPRGAAVSANVMDPEAVGELVDAGLAKALAPRVLLTQRGVAVVLHEWPTVSLHH